MLLMQKVMGSPSSLVCAPNLHFSKAGATDFLTDTRDHYCTSTAKELRMKLGDTWFVTVDGQLPNDLTLGMFK